MLNTDYTNDTNAFYIKRSLCSLRVFPPISLRLKNYLSYPNLCEVHNPEAPANY